MIPYMTEQNSNWARLKQIWWPLFHSPSEKISLKQIADFIWYPLLQLSEEAVIFLHNLKRAQFALIVVLCIVLGLATANLANFHKFAELSEALLVAFLGIAITGVIFIATLMNERIRARQQHFDQLRQHLASNRRVLNQAFQKYFFDIAAPAQGKEWEFIAVMRAYILANVNDQGSGQLAQIYQKLNELFPNRGYYAAHDINSLVQETFQWYDAYYHRDLTTLVSAVRHSVEPRTVYELDQLIAQFQDSSISSTAYSLQSMLGRRIFRVIAYTALILIVLWLIPTIAVARWDLFPGYDLQSRVIVKTMIAATTFGAASLILRYFFLLIHFVQQENAHDIRAPFVTSSGQVGGMG